MAKAASKEGLGGQEVMEAQANGWEEEAEEKARAKGAEAKVCSPMAIVASTRQRLPFRVSTASLHTGGVQSDSTHLLRALRNIGRFVPGRVPFPDCIN